MSRGDLRGIHSNGTTSTKGEHPLHEPVLAVASVWVARSRASERVTIQHSKLQYQPNLRLGTFSGSIALGEFKTGPLLWPFGEMGAPMPSQNRWRNCSHCQALFFNGHTGNRGICPDGGGHTPAGADFTLLRDQGAPLFVVADNGWRNCKHCQVLYFSGHAGPDGRCPRPGGEAGHESAPNAYDFVLPYSGLVDGAATQPQWRNCWKCQAMYFDGFPSKGKCPSGGEHWGNGADPATKNFRLSYPMSPNIVTSQFGTDARVDGIGFTPESRVECTRTPFRSGFIPGPTDRSWVSTGHEGDFTLNFTIATDPWDFYAVHARDEASSTAADRILPA